MKDVQVKQITLCHGKNSIQQEEDFLPPDWT
jgi:hypothetical protein